MDIPLTTRRRQIALAWRPLAPLLFYAGLALLLTWPLALRFFTAVPGNGFDSWQNMWNMWWLRKALLEGYPPYFTHMLYHPQGAPLFLHTLNPINFLISLPVHALFGLVAAYNFVVLISLTLSGYFSYLLAFDVIGNRRAALVSGAVFAFSGYLLAQVMGGHTHMMAAWGLPLAVLALRRADAQPSRWRIGLAGLALALNLLADWQYFLFIMIWAGWYGLSRVWLQRNWRAALPTLAAGCLAVLLALPLAIPTARFAATIETASTEGGPDFRQEQSVDLADLLIPSQLHPLWGRLAEQLQSYKAETHIQNKTAYLGLVTLLLAGIGAGQRAGRFWLLSALLFGLLAMGPVLQIAGWNSGLPLPGVIIFELPLVNIFRYPVRYMALAMLALAVLAGLGTQRLLAMRWLGTAENAEAGEAPRSHSANLLVGLLIGLIVLDNLTLPFPMAGIYIPPIFNQMAQDEEPYALLEAPFYYFSSPVYMLYQVVHDKPLVGGYTSRRLPYKMLAELSILRQFAFAEPAPDIIAQDPQRIAASVFDYFDIRYVLLHSDGGALRYGALPAIAQAAAGGMAPIEQGGTTVVPDARGASGLIRSLGPGRLEPAGSLLIYEVVPPEDPRPFLGIGPGWAAPVVAADGSVSRQLDGSGEIVIYSAIDRRLRLSIDVVEQNGAATLYRGEDILARHEPGSGPLHVTLDISAGESRLRLAGNAVVRGIGVEVVGEG
jgi:hypothetical protein